ncbi:hypothetical protein Q7F20_02860 [Curtobacterium sp. A7_M15]|uniref:hypothetical protein n=1 Tax=Curtobacterium sp. A7_M15 TaxID=3065241 RepID=UPI002737BB48|nr:hypothetical protein [Curtobacterium sp. A7_M15]MDP4332299.1 hypothetical protein [Curtobacterium sp. A7_M15]
MESRDPEHDTDEPEEARATEPRWLRRTPIRPVEWWGPPLAQLIGSSLVLALGTWLHVAGVPGALFAAVVTGTSGVVGAVALGIVGHEAYQRPSRATSWRLHRVRVASWSAGCVALFLYALVVGAQTILFAVVIGLCAARFLRHDDPTRFELLGRSAATAAVAVLSAVFAVVALTVPGIDGAHAARWIGWGVVVVPVSVISAVMDGRGASRTTEPDRVEGPLSAPDRTAS